MELSKNNINTDILRNFIKEFNTSPSHTINNIIHYHLTDRSKQSVSVFRLIMFFLKSNRSSIYYSCLQKLSEYGLWQDILSICEIYAKYHQHISIDMEIDLFIIALVNYDHTVPFPSERSHFDKKLNFVHNITNKLKISRKRYREITVSLRRKVEYKEKDIHHFDQIWHLLFLSNAKQDSEFQNIFEEITVEKPSNKTAICLDVIDDCIGKEISIGIGAELIASRMNTLFQDEIFFSADIGGSVDYGALYLGEVNGNFMEYLPYIMNIFSTNHKYLINRICLSELLQYIKSRYLDHNANLFNQLNNLIIFQHSFDSRTDLTHIIKACSEMRPQFRDYKFPAICVWSVNSFVDRPIGWIDCNGIVQIHGYSLDLFKALLCATVIDENFLKEQGLLNYLINVDEFESAPFTDLPYFDPEKINAMKF